MGLRTTLIFSTVFIVYAPILWYFIRNILLGITKLKNTFWQNKENVIHHHLLNKFYMWSGSMIMILSLTLFILIVMHQLMFYLIGIVTKNRPQYHKRPLIR